VANAIWDGSVAVMSQRDRDGKFPLESVQARAKIVEENRKLQGIIRHTSSLESMDCRPREKRRSHLQGGRRAFSTRRERGSAAILSHTGASPRTSKYRPDTVIYAICRTEEARNRMAMLHNVMPIMAPKTDEGPLASFAKILIGHGLAAPGDEIICLSGESPNRVSGVDTIRLIKL
jgi:pyruvate kinase